MADEHVILTAERLRDDVAELARALRSRYPQASRQVTNAGNQDRAARLAETWLVELATDQALEAAIGSAALADLNVHFQRLLTFAEHATKRSRYDAELRAILDDYTVKVILPLKQARGRSTRTAAPPPINRTVVHSAFVGQSFAPNDKRINECVSETLSAVGVRVVTGEKPKAELISDKVKRLIEDQAIFVAIFTRRDKIARKSEWTTSSWVIDEKAYALGRKKPLILLKEQGVGSIGGIQGDYEYVEFSRESLEILPIRILEMFELLNQGLRS